MRPRLATGIRAGRAAGLGDLSGHFSDGIADAISLRTIEPNGVGVLVGGFLLRAPIGFSMIVLALVSRAGTRSRTNMTYSACSRPGINTATASGSAKPVM